MHFYTISTHTINAVGRAAIAVRWGNPPSCIILKMHLLYLDDSGSPSNPTEDFFVLGGLSVFEGQIYFLTKALNELAETIQPKDPLNLEFHASEIFNRRSEPWKSMDKDEVTGVIKSILKIFISSHDSTKAFACAIHKNSYPDKDVVEVAFEDLCCRFDFLLDRLEQSGDRQRGQIVLDKSSYEMALQGLAKSFPSFGAKWKKIRNLADIPFFVDSESSRLIQIADSIAYAVFRRYNYQDNRFFDIICQKFDTVDNVIHGLAHKQTVFDHRCMCPACITRR